MPNNVFQLSDDLRINNEILIESCRETIIDQSEAMRKLAESMNVSEFAKALSLMKCCGGHVIVCGMGKSGHVGKKMSATLASTGTPSFFLHPAEAFHGDLGMVTSNDVVILISNSGETDEILKLIPSLNNFGNKIIAITGKKESTLAKNADALLLIDLEKESCPNNLAPTTSTTLTMAIGDALAVALIKARNFLPVDFAKFHPGGSLGKRLLTQVKDVMLTKNLPFVLPNTPIEEVIIIMTSSRLGVAIVVENNQLCGLITDGDLRRSLVSGIDIKCSIAKNIMNEKIITVISSTSLSDAEDIMRDTKVKILIVTDNKSVVGIVEFYQ